MNDTNPLPGNAGYSADSSPYRNNPDIDAKIDAYIRENPKYWAYIQGMPRERLERTIVLNEVQKIERQLRFREGLLKQINQNPELKQAYEVLVKNVPEEQREKAMVQMASKARHALNQNQATTVNERV